MKTKIILTSFSIVIIIIITIFSCAKKDNPKCLSCEFIPDGSTTFRIKLLSNEEVVAKVNYFTGEKAGITDHQIGISKIDNNSFEKLTEFVKNQTNSQSTLLSIVLYFKGDFIETSEISSKNFTAFSFFQISNSKLYHKLYTKTEEGFEEIKAMNLEVDRIFFSNLDFVITRVIKENSNQMKSYLVLLNEDISSSPKLNQPRNEFLLKKQILSRLFNPNRDIVPPGGGGHPVCPAQYPCPGPVQDAYCDVYPNGQGECQPCCSFNCEQQIVADCDTVSPSLYLAFDTVLHHHFRDNFMYNYEIGRKYIDYYYAVSGYLGGDIPLSLSIETAWLFYHYNDDIEHLLDTVGHSNDVLIDNAFEEALLDALRNYKLLSSDSVYTNMFDEMIADIGKLKGKTIQEILNEIE